MNPNTKEAIIQFREIENEFREKRNINFLVKDWKDADPIILVNSENFDFLEENFTKAVLFQRKRELYLKELELLHKIVINALFFQDSKSNEIANKSGIYVIELSLNKQFGLSKINTVDVLEEGNWRKYLSKQLAERILEKFSLFDITDIQIRLIKTKFDLILTVYTTLNKNKDFYEQS